jgi:hypothetical protein
VATSDVDTLEHPAMYARLCSRLSALRTLPKATCDPEKSAPCFSSSPRRGQDAFRTGKREMINASRLI